MKISLLLLVLRLKFDVKTRWYVHRDLFGKMVGSESKEWTFYRSCKRVGVGDGWFRSVTNIFTNDFISQYV